ncbi:unnamed protein product [Zymoseptoria tritici ST99CH_3D1]|nr:unnamed protein product [Zymoseptoria tritici ST99CH_3D1]
MSKSNDAGHFFQTTEALATTSRKAAKAKNKHGDPIKMSSKVLALCPDIFSDPSNPAIFVAEAVGEVKRVFLEDGKTERTFNGSSAPLTCLAICPITKTLFTGSWDKSIYAIPLSSPSSYKTLASHTDFLKTLLTASLNGKPILVSGSADASIIIWDITTSSILHKVPSAHSKAIQHLSIDPLSLTSDSFTLFSTSSSPEIRRWHVSLDSCHELPESVTSPIRPHETSIYSLTWDSDGEGLWTASADFTAKHLVRHRDWSPDTTLQHKDFVRDVLPIEELGLVVTACRDEGVRVWDASSGKLIVDYEGHFEEVMALVAGRKGREVVSAGIDGTVRRWGLSREGMREFADERERERNGVVKEDEEKKGKEGMLTAEEEAELAELMGSDDDE